MEPIDFPEANTRLRKPAEWTDAQCQTITAWQGKILLPEGGETAGFITCWQLTAADMDELIANKGKIYVQMCSPAFFPLSVYPQNPFGMAVPGPEAPESQSPLIIVS